ncbi:MAG: adenylate/guanylate cyclase domain-containing protein [Reichenbachiella sp.]
MKFKKNLTDWMFCVAAWSLASYVFFIAGYFYLAVLQNLEGVGQILRSNEIFIYMNSGMQFIEIVLFGIVFGSMFFLIHWIIKRTALKYIPFGRIILIQTFSYIFGFFLSFLIIFLVLTFFEITPLDERHELELLFLHRPFFITMAVFLTFFSLLINFILEVREKIGPTNLWHMVIGKYHHPIVEERVFLFLDLKESTVYAEKLGHIKYSKLIQKCFYLLNDIVYKHRAQVYQYVGDEVVLTWPMKEKNVVNHSVALYYDYKKLLESKEKMFLDRFGFVPLFKAGINEGKVTAAEVGNIKREIAYHGDVLNTGSRIQDKCSELGKNLLVSEIIANEIRNDKHFTTTSMGKVNLKGKQNAVNIFAIEQA